jgi:hypothetical protein
MNRNTNRFFHVLFIALTLLLTVISPAAAQSSTSATIEPVRLLFADGRTVSGRHAVADDFVIVCPTLEVLDPSHPCSECNSTPVQSKALDELALVCPVKEVLDANHPCSETRKRAVGRTVTDDFVLVCPMEEVLDPNHPCAESNSASNSATVRFEMPKDYVLTCPAKEVLDPRHPCYGK